MVTFFRALSKSFLHITFPAKCLHCGFLLPPGPVVLCPGCASQLDLIVPEGRCTTCFNPLAEHAILCDDCLQYPSPYSSVGAAFNYDGPAASLIKHLKYGNQPYLAKGMAAYLVAQFDRLGWPMPDALIPVPLSFGRWLERGYNQSALLAEEMSIFLQCPVWNVLTRQSGDFSQAALPLEKRKELDGSRFKVKPGNSLEGKYLLVIDDVMTSGSTLRCCAEMLNSQHPASLYALTFCRA